MKKLKSLLALLLAIVMVVGMFAGCAKTETETPSDSQESTDTPAADSTETEAPAEEEGATITMAMYSAYEHTSDDWIFQKIKEYTGVTVEPICYSREVYEEKLSTFLAGDMPDLWLSYSLQSSEITTYGDQGAFVNLYDYMDQLPNFKAIFIDNSDNYANFSAYDSTATGGNYAMPIYNLNRDVNHGNMYRADVLEETGLDVWFDSESFYEVLKAMKELYPDSYPLTGAAWTEAFDRWAAAYDINNLDTAYDWETGTWYLGGTSENYYEMLKFFQKLYTEGLMDPDFFTNDTDTASAKLLNNEAFVWNQWIGRMGILNPQGQELIGEQYDMVYGPAIGNGNVLALSRFSAGTGVLVKNGENKEAALKVMDFLYSDKGSELFTIGEEGENFEWDENGTAVYADLEEVNINTLEEAYGMWIEGYYVNVDHRSCYFNFTDHEQAAQDLINANNSYLQPIPPTIVSDEYATTYTDLLTQYQAKFDEFTANFVTNSSYGDAEWNNWVETANATYGEIIDILNNN